MAGAIEQLLRLVTKADTGDLDKTVRSLDGVDRAAKKTGDSFGSLSKKGAEFGAGLIGINSALEITKKALEASVGQAASFERTLNVLRVQANATAGEVQQISQRAKELGNDLTLPGVSASDAAAAMLELSKAGLSIRDTMTAARGALALARTENIDFGTAAQITASQLNAFQLAGIEATRVADLLAAGSINSQASVLSLGQGMQQAAAIFNGANQDIEDLVTSMALMEQAGVKGSDAGTSLKTAVLALRAPTNEAAAEMKKLGIEVRDADGQMKKMPALVAEFTGKLGGLSAAQRDAALKTIFGNDAIRAGEIVLTRGAESYNRMREAVTKSGAAQELAGAQAKGLSGSLQGLQSQVETIALTAGQKLVPSLTQVVNTLSAALASDTVRTFGVGLEQVIGTLGRIAEGFAAMPEPARAAALAVIGLTGALSVLAAHPVIGTLTVLTAGLVLLAGKIEEANNKTAGSTEELYLRAQAIVASGMGQAKDAVQQYTAELNRLDQQNLTTAQKVEFLRARHEELNKSVNDSAAEFISLAERKRATGEEADKLRQRIVDESVQMGVLEQLANKLGYTLSTNVKSGATDAQRALSGIGDAGKDVTKAETPLNDLQTLLQAIFKDGKEVQRLIRDIISPPTQVEANVTAQLANIDAALKGVGLAARISGDEKAYWIAKARELLQAAGLETDVLTRANAVIDQVAKGNLSAADASKKLTDILKGSIETREAIVEAESATREAAGKSAEAQLGLGRSLDTVRQEAQDAANVYRGIFPQALGEAGQAAQDVGPRLRDILSPEFVADLERRAKSLGLTVPAGMAAGIREGKQDAINAALDLASAVEGAARERLRAQSPSQVFVQIGDDVVSGLLIAWQRQEGVVTHALVNLFDRGIAVVEASAVRLVQTFDRTVSTLADSIAKTAEAGRALRLMEQEVSRLDTAIADLTLKLAYAEPYSAYRAELEHQKQVLEAWRGQVQASIGVLQAQRRELDLTRSALDGYTQAYIDAVTGALRAQQFGPGASLVTLLTGDLTNPETGARISAALEALIQQAIAAGVPAAAALGSALRDAVATALANPTAENIQAVLNGLEHLFEQMRERAALSAKNLNEAIQQSLDLKRLAKEVGEDGARLVEELGKALKDGGQVAVAEVGRIAAGILAQLEELPDDIGGPLAADLRRAMEEFAVNPTEDGLERIRAILAKSKGVLEILPRNLRELKPDVQAAIQAIVDQFLAGQLSIEEAVDAIARATKRAQEEAKKVEEAARRAADAARQAASGAKSYTTTTRSLGGTQTAVHNYGGVRGATLYTFTDEEGFSTEHLSLTKEILDAYGGNYEAARRDIERRALGEFGHAFVGEGGKFEEEDEDEEDDRPRSSKDKKKKGNGKDKGKKYAAGLAMGPIRRPTILMDEGTGIPFGSMAERGPEWIVNQAQMREMTARAAAAPSINITVPITGNFLMDEDAGQRLAIQLAPALSTAIAGLREARYGSTPLGAR